MVGAGAEADFLEEGPGPGPRLLLRAACDEQRHRHVLERGELRQEVVELEDEAEGAVAELAAPCLAEGEHVLAGDGEGAAVRAVEVPRTWRSVDFPTPEAPTTATISPAPTSRSTPHRTETSPAGSCSSS